MTTEHHRPTPTHRPSAATLASLLIAGALLAACATNTPSSRSNAQNAREQSAKSAPTQLSFKLPSGIYRCESGQQVEIQRSSTEIGLAWQGSQRTLRRYDSDSGLPRFEDRDNGLLWIDLPWKSVLMDSRSGRPLANDCKSAKG